LSHDRRLGGTKMKKKERIGEEEGKGMGTVQSYKVGSNPGTKRIATQLTPKKKI